MPRRDQCSRAARVGAAKAGCSRNFLAAGESPDQPRTVLVIRDTQWADHSSCETDLIPAALPYNRSLRCWSWSVTAPMTWAMLYRCCLGWEGWRGCSRSSCVGSPDVR